MARAVQSLSEVWDGSLVWAGQCTSLAGGPNQLSSLMLGANVPSCPPPLYRCGYGKNNWLCGESSFCFIQSLPHISRSLYPTILVELRDTIPEKQTGQMSKTAQIIENMTFHVAIIGRMGVFFCSIWKALKCLGDMVDWYDQTYVYPELYFKKNRCHNSPWNS